MQVPSIADLRDVFGQSPESVAEVSYGTMLPLDRWPDGEVLLTATVLGRTASVYLRPLDGHLRIQIDAPTPIVLLSFVNVERAEAQLGNSSIRALSFTIREPQGERSFVLRTYPEIDLRSI